MAIKGDKNTRIYAFENVSHIPTSELVRIFEIDLNKDPNILEGYFLTDRIYKKNRSDLEKLINPINLNKFEYCLRQYGCSKDYIRKMYKKKLME